MFYNPRALRFRGLTYHTGPIVGVHLRYRIIPLLIGLEKTGRWDVVDPYGF
jgi:hypothetical protein